MAKLEAIKRYESAKRQRQKKDPKFRELDAFDRGEQWNLGGNQLPPWIPKPVTNYVHLVKTTKRASLAIENPSAMIMGQSPDDQQLAREFQKIFEFVWDQMKARKTVREALETSKLLGTGIVQVHYDNENNTVKGGKGGKYTGDIKVKHVDPAIFYPDPNAFRIDDCEYIVLRFRRPISWIEKEFGVKLDAREIANEERGEIYQRDYNSEEHDKIIDFLEYYEKVANDKDTGGFTYYVTYLAGEKVVQERKELKPNCYPFAILYDFPQRQDFWGQSICELILDNQKLINKVESIMALIGALLQNPQKIVNARSGIDPEEAAKYGSAPGHTFLANGDPSQAMVWQTPPTIPQPLFALVDQARSNIREITGLSEAYMGQSVGSLQTSQGVNSLIERSTMRDRDQMYDFELFIEELSTIIIKFIMEYHTETRLARVLENPGEEPKFIEYKGSDFKDLKFDLKVDVSAKAPITRVRKQEELDKLLTLQGQMQFDPKIITPQEYMRESDYVDSEKFITRMNKEEIESAQAILQETTQMIQEGLTQGLDPMEVGQMAQAMVEQRFEQKQQGTGSTAENSGQMQMRQGQPSQQF